MNVLLAYASRHGSTREISETIADELRRSGLSVDLLDVRDVQTAMSYDTVILGTAIYMGQWMSEARSFVDRFESELRSMPVWIFTSGPIGDDPFPKADPPETAEMLQRIGAREHYRFLGKLDRERLGIGEKLITRVLRAPEGDFRDWNDIRRWAGVVAVDMKSSPEPVTDFA